MYIDLVTINLCPGQGGGGVKPSGTLDIVENGEYDVYSYALASVNIPQSVTGFTQKDITEGVQIADLTNSASSVCPFAFANNSYLQNVYLSNCSFVGSYAFFQCPNLKVVNLPVCKIIGEGAFNNSPISNNIFAPECISTQTDAFGNCSINSIDLPKCKYIADLTFNNCVLLSKVNLPECTYIGPFAFTNCMNLQSINIEKCLTIDANVFEVLPSLSSLNLPVIKNIGQNAFIDCSNFSQLTLCTETYIIPSYDDAFVNTPFNEGIGSIYVDAALYDTFISSTGWSSFSSLFVSVGTSDPMLSFSDGLFYGKTPNIYQNWNVYTGIPRPSVTKVSLSECKILPGRTFENCQNLSEVNLPKCSILGSSAFMTCYKLTSINIPEIISISESAFYGCGLSEIDLHSCEYIGKKAFYLLRYLSKVTFRGNKVCSLYDSMVFSQNKAGSIKASFFVPASLVDAYKIDWIWSWYSSRIFPIE